MKEARSTATIDIQRTTGTVSRRIYGQFSEHLGRCIYEGLWVGEDSPIPNTKGIRNDVLAALQRLNIPVLRWPGGCFADEYHWKDGIGPRQERKRMVNTHWGGVVENNHFGTHEFMDLCDLLGAEAYICGNVGSGTVQEMQEWVEYLTFEGESPMARWREANGRKAAWTVPWFGVGNENWGCGGNMRAEYYADEYRRYQTYVRNYNPNNKIRKIAGGANVADYHWTEVLMREAHWLMDGLSLHCYTVPGTWEDKHAATGFRLDGWYETMRKTMYMDELITRHSAIMDRYDPAGRVELVVDEWGTWFKCEPGTNPGFLYQQNTLRDALVAGLHFHIFHKHNRRVKMANIAQMVNVLQAMVLTEGDKMLCTPTYHVFEMFKTHQDGELLDLHVTASDPIPEPEGNPRHLEGVPTLSLNATRGKDGSITISACNPHHELARTVRLNLAGLGAASLAKAQGRTLTHQSLDAHNTFAKPDNVAPRPLAVSSGEGWIEATFGPASVSVIHLPL